MKAWHWTTRYGLRNRDPIPEVGVTLVHDGPVEWCVSGLHASRRILDALRYAPGPVVHRVECGRIVEEGTDKFVCRERTILWSVDAEELLGQFARRCALDVVDLWDAPDVVVEYLRTGDEGLRSAARDAARAAWDAGWYGAWDAGWDAPRSGPWSASIPAPAAASRASMFASRYAAVLAAWYVARYAGVYAARAAAWDSDGGSARAAAYYAARDRQNRRLTAMVSVAERRGA